MATVSVYLNFNRETEAAFEFYKSVFKTDYLGEINRFGGMPQVEGMPSTAEEDKNLILHVTLPILGGHLLMGSDVPESHGHQLINGNNVQIMLNTDSKEQTDELFNALSEGGKVLMPLQFQFWGDYYGHCLDKFGIQWMFDYNPNQ